MTPAQKPLPTDSELAILQVLWGRGSATVRDVHEALERDGIGYTTTLKQLQVMHEKGLVERDESRRAHLYSPAQPRGEVERGLVRDLRDRAFFGSAARMVMQALAQEPATEEELDRIRRLLDEFEERRG